MASEGLSVPARAVLRRLVIKNVLTDRDIERPYALAGLITAMLTKAIITLEKRA